MTCFDESGFIEPQYDSTSAAYTPAQRIALADTGGWKTAIRTMANCRFANRQNAGADFRLFVGPNRVKIHRVKLLPEPVREWQTRKSDFVLHALDHGTT